MENSPDNADNWQDNPDVDFDFTTEDPYITPYDFNYILNAQGEPEVCRDLRHWGAWFHTDERRAVRQQRWTNAEGEPVFVSTVFLGMDHAFTGGPPVLWETMAWVGDRETNDEVGQWRYTSRENAIGGHAAVVIMLGGTPLDEPVPAALERDALEDS